MHYPIPQDISHHSVGDAPTNPKFLDFYQFEPYFHLVESFFIFFCNFYKKNSVIFFSALKKNDFFTEMGKNIVLGHFCQKIVIFVEVTKKNEK